VILASYVGSLLMAGAFLAVGSMISATTKNQVIAFVVTTAVLFVFALAGSDAVLEAFRGWAPAIVVDLVAGFGFLTHFQSIARGVIDLRDAIFFGSVIVLALFANALIVDLKKAD
jgi:ABC-2 type transport system permease protein